MMPAPGSQAVHDPGPAQPVAAPDHAEHPRHLPGTKGETGDDVAVGLTIELLRRERPITSEEAAQIRSALADLRRVSTRLRSCRVTITGFGRAPDGLARAYTIRLDLRLGEADEMEIGRNARPGFGEALRDAFGEAELLLAEHERRWRAMAPSRSELGAERRGECERRKPSPPGSDR